MSLKIIWLVSCIIAQLVFSTHQSVKPQSPQVSSCPVSGVPGVPGVPGLSGRDGAKGDQGRVGAPGKIGPQGPEGPKGSEGPVGPPGKIGPKGTEGDKGEKGLSGVVPQRNWKQCTWKPLEEGKDYGLIKDCVFTKINQDTALKVEFDGDFRVAHCTRCCKRWYFTFNGVECSNPATIDAIDAILQNHGRTDTNLHKHSQIGGYCEGISKGTVRVGLVVGDCPGSKSGSNAYAGHKSVTRIMIEEVSKPQ